MPKARAAPESPFYDASFPVNGVDVSTALEKQHPETTPDGINVRTFEPTTLRARGGSRPGLSKYIPETLVGSQMIPPLTTPSQVQHLQIVVDPQADALPFLGDGTVTDPSSGGRGFFINGDPILWPVGGTGFQPNPRVTIGKFPLTITANNQTKGTGTQFTWTGTEFTSSGLEILDSITSVQFASQGAPPNAPTGAYKIQPSHAAIRGPAGEDVTDHYSINYVKGTLTVTGNNLTITANDETKVRGTTFTFNGTEYTQTGLQGGDTITSVTLTSPGASSGAAVGSYPITASAAVISGPGSGTYAITYKQGTMTVTETPVISWSGIQKKLGAGNAKTFDSPVTAGNLILVLENDATGITGVTDNLGNTYSKAIGKTQSGFGFDREASIWWAQTASSGACTVTGSGGTASPSIGVWEMKPSTPSTITLDGTGSGGITGSSGSCDTGLITVGGVSPELMIGFYNILQAATYDAVLPFTDPSGNPPYFLSSLASAVTCTITIEFGSGVAAVVGASFKATPV